MKDEIFQQLAEGKANAQYVPSLQCTQRVFRSLFMQGKFKVLTRMKSLTCIGQGSIA